MGIFPIPSRLCLSEFDYLDWTSPFRCTNANLFNNFLTGYFQLGGNQAWWSNYVYAQKDEDNKFNRVAMAEITVQTEFNNFDTDAWKGMEMVNAWQDWADDYNKKNEGVIGAAKVSAQLWCGNKGRSGASHGANKAARTKDDDAVNCERAASGRHRVRAQGSSMSGHRFSKCHHVFHF